MPVNPLAPQVYHIWPSQHSPKNQTFEEEKKKIMRTSLPQLYLRIALGTGFFLLGLDRLGAWGPHGRSWVSWGDWQHFSAYAHQVMNFLPWSLAEMLAVVATIVEITGGFLLLTGLFTRWAAYACSILTFCFAVAMAISGGITSPIDYSVFSVSAACWLLAIQPSYRWSIDAVRQRSKRSDQPSRSGQTDPSGLSVHSQH